MYVLKNLYNFRITYFNLETLPAYLVKKPKNDTFLRGTAKRQCWQVRSKRTLHSYVRRTHALKWWNVDAACRGRDWQVVQKISLIKTLWIANKKILPLNNSWILPPPPSKHNSDSWKIRLLIDYNCTRLVTVNFPNCADSTKTEQKLLI